MSENFYFWQSISYWEKNFHFIGSMTIKSHNWFGARVDVDLEDIFRFIQWFLSVYSRYWNILWILVDHLASLIIKFWAFLSSSSKKVVQIGIHYHILDLKYLISKHHLLRHLKHNNDENPKHSKVLAEKTF